MKPKILFICNIDWFFISHRLPLAYGAFNNGFEVHIATAITDQSVQQMHKDFYFHDIPFKRRNSSLVDLIFSLRSIYALIKKIKPSIVHSITIQPIIISGLCSYFFSNILFVYAISGLGPAFNPNNKVELVRMFFIKFLYSSFFRSRRAHVIFQNHEDLHCIQSITGLSNVRYSVIRGSGVSIPAYSSEYSFMNRTCVVMASRLLSTKGVFEYHEAVKMLKEKHRSYRFILAGAPDAGSQFSLTESDINSLKQCTSLEYLGFVDDIPSLFLTSLIVVLPSYYPEGLPKVLCEAAACGCIVVTTDMPGCRDAVVPNVTGALVAPRSVMSLYQVLDKLLTSSQNHLRMSSKAREFAELNFNIDSIVSQHLSIYFSSLR